MYLFLYNKKISKYLYVSFSAVICVAFLVHIITSTMFSVEFIDVGQGDSALITAPYRKYYLIDTGKGSSFACSTYLKNKGIVNLETVFITHVDDDHSGGLENILKEFHVKKVVMPKTDSVKEFIPLITCAGTDFEYADGFSGYKIGDGFADVVWPYPNKILTNVENNNSLCIRLQYKNYSFLFTGDLGVEAEKELLQTSEYLRSNILKVGHHGSKTSTSEEFLNEVLPKYGIVSVGKDNSYGHPETEIIDRLNEYGCKILRTDKLGNIIFTVVFGRLVLVN